MHAKLKNLLGNPLSAAQRLDFGRSLVKSRYLPTMLVGLVIALFEVVMIIVTVSRPGGAGATQGRAVFFWLYVVLLVATLLTLGAGLLLRRTTYERPRVFMALVTGYSLFICLWSSYLTAFSHRGAADATVFMYTVLTVAVINLLRPWMAIGLYLANLLFFYGCLVHFAGPGVDVYASVVNSAIASALAIVISAVLWHSRLRDFTNQTTILRQNEEISKINDQLREMVYVDDLTRAHNRRYFDEVLPEKLDEARAGGLAVCVMMLDLDHFKEYNDLNGHQAGDACLVTFAAIVHGFMEKHTGAFVRYGGEEFVLLLPGMGVQAGLKAAEDIRRRVQDAGIPHRGSEVGVLTTSVGVRVSEPDEEATVAQLTADADEALYVAKNAGRNRVKLFYH